jgi:hypothetical protein
MRTEFWWERQKERVHEEGGRIIIKWTLEREKALGGMDWIDLFRDRD